MRRGHIPILEADAYHLPDAATTYRRAHSKTTIAVVDVDPAARTVRYLHNSGCFAAGGEDFDGLFRVGGAAPSEEVLPPYLEAAKLGYKVIEKMPKDRDAVVYLGYSLLYLGRYDDLLKLKYLHQRYTNYLRWLTWNR